MVGYRGFQQVQRADPVGSATTPEHSGERSIARVGGGGGDQDYVRVQFGVGPIVRLQM